MTAANDGRADLGLQRAVQIDRTGMGKTGRLLGSHRGKSSTSARRKSMNSCSAMLLAKSAEAEDSMARRHDTPGDVAA